MNIFYRDFDSGSPVSSGSKWLAALAARVAISFGKAIPFGRLTSGEVWVLSLVLAAWFGTSVFPMTAGLAAIVNAVIVGIGALRLLGKVKEIGANLAAGLKAAYEATSDADLEVASGLIAKSLDEYAINALSAMVNDSTFRAIESAALRMFPIPDWFSSVYEKGMFYRDFDPTEPVSSGARWFAALIARIGVTVAESFAYTQIKREILLSAQQLWMLAILLGGWFTVSVLPATAGIVNVVNTILLAIGLAALLDRAAVVGSALAAGLRGAYEARNESDLDAAAKALAPALTGAVITALEVLVTHQAFRVAESATLRRFPVPDWFRSRFEKAQARRATQTDSTSPEKKRALDTSPEQQRPPRRAAEEPREGRKQPKEPRPARVIRAAVELEGARKSARVVQEMDVATIEALIGAGVLVLGLGITATLIARRKP